MWGIVGPYLVGFLGGACLLVVAFLLYERAHKLDKAMMNLQKDIIHDLQRQLNATLSKMMAVDYEKLAEADIRARSFAAASMQSWDQEFMTPEMDDMDIFNPEDYRVKKDAEQTS